MTRRTARAALAVQTALADHRQHQLDAARAHTAALAADLAVTDAVARALLRRNAELAARPPIEIVVQGRDVLDAFAQQADFVLWDMEIEP